MLAVGRPFPRPDTSDDSAIAAVKTGVWPYATFFLMQRANAFAECFNRNQGICNSVFCCLEENRELCV